MATSFLWLTEPQYLTSKKEKKMNDKNKEIALFKLMVLGPLTSRSNLVHGELKTLTYELASKSYNIPYSKRCYLSHNTIERWYYEWRRGGFDNLTPKKRTDFGSTTLSESLQTKILQLKKENPARSINTIIEILAKQGIVSINEICRATVHRFLQKNNMSKRTLANAQTIERRSFEAKHASDLWQADVMHGPRVPTSKGLKKTYLVSLMDDASRLMAHSVFAFGETALEIEACLKQAILKRGLPRLLILDNGSAYRSRSFQYICAKLGIRLSYCPAYEPEGKGKLERFHRTVREQFLNELNLEMLTNVDDLNSRWWAWLDEIYHRRPHSALAGNSSPIERWRCDLIHVRSLGSLAQNIDDYFYHRIKRTVKKDGTVTYQGKSFEVPYELSGQKLNLVIDPHDLTAKKVESLEGEYLGCAYPTDKRSNRHRKRQRPGSAKGETSNEKTSIVELAHQTYTARQLITCNSDSNDEEEF